MLGEVTEQVQVLGRVRRVGHHHVDRPGRDVTAELTKIRMGDHPATGETFPAVLAFAPRCQLRNSPQDLVTSGAFVDEVDDLTVLVFADCPTGELAELRLVRLGEETMPAGMIC